MLSHLPTRARRAMWSPLTASKQPFQYHISSHTIKTQPDLVAQQDHNTRTHSSTGMCTLPKPHPTLQGCSARALTSLEVLHSSGGASCNQPQTRCTATSVAFYSAFASLGEQSQDGSVSLHTLWCLPFHTQLE